ncbi:MAG: ABC transporter ATP-binding protein [Rhodomicrobium sp.]
MTGRDLLELDGITKQFGGLAANSGISIRVRQGELLGLIGPNGAGKSTLFNIIAGSYPPTSGKIIFDGIDITRASAAGRCALGIARTFQVPKSFESMTVLDNVTVGAFVRAAGSKAARQAAIEALEFTALASRAAVPASELTPPERRRLEMARALATKPKLLLLDEVLTGLTPSEAAKGAELVRKIRQHGITIIMVEHVMEVVMPLVERVIVLDLGSVLFEGAPDEVVRDPSVIRAYLGDRARAA